MRVVIQAQPNASGSIPSPYLFELAAGGIESPADLKINGQRNTQPFFGLRAVAAKYIDRLNARNTISFKITRLHASIDAAQTYMLLHQSTVPGGGTVSFYSESGSKFTMTDSVLQVVDQNHLGKTTFHNYSLVGGVISQS
jgi:hypothetical protein